MRNADCHTMSIIIAPETTSYDKFWNQNESLLISSMLLAVILRWLHLSHINTVIWVTFAWQYVAGISAGHSDTAVCINIISNILYHSKFIIPIA